MAAGSGGAGGEGSAGHGAASGASPWWSDALNDPWRDPAAPTVITHVTPPEPPPPDPTPEIVTSPPGGLRRTVAVAALVGLLAGGLGGAIGYVAATHRGNAPVVLGGSRASSAVQIRPPGSTAALVAHVMPSVVTVQGTTASGASIGSGFVLTANGYLLTNDHVLTDVPDDAVSVMLSDATTLPAKIVGRDQESDLAVLKVDRPNLQPADFGDSDQVAVGDDVLAIGAPLALSGTVTRGIVSALDRTIETRDADGVQRYYAAIQTDAAINRGSSGGPLFDDSGRVIGVNSVIRSTGADEDTAGNIGIAFAIPINQASRVATELIETGRAHRTVLGAKFDSVRVSSGGVRLSSVDEGGPAASAGLQPGDVVTRIGSHLVEQPGDLIALVRRYDPGTVVVLVFRRGTATQTASVTLVADAN